MDASRRQETLASETKKFITHGTAGLIDLIFTLVLLPHSPKGIMQGSPGQCSTFSGFVSLVMNLIRENAFF